MLRKYDEFGNPRKVVSGEDSYIERLVKCLDLGEQRVVEKNLSLDAIENAADFIIASSPLISTDSLENLFHENIDDEKIKVSLLTTQGSAKEYLLYQTGEESFKINNEVVPMCDYKARTKNNFARTFSSRVYETIKGIQKKKVESIIKYIPKDGSNILDFGCGTGYSTIPLAKKFPSKEIVATDFSDEALRTLNTAIRKGGIENVKTCEEDSECLHFRFGEKYFGASVGINAIEETLPWKVFYGLKEVTNGPIIIVQDAFDYSQIHKWAGWYGLNIKSSFSIESPESEKGENEVYVISKR